MSEESTDSDKNNEVKPKILVLHGFGQTVNIIKKRGQNLFKTLSRDYDLYFPEAKYDVILQNPSGTQNGKAWFYYDEKNPSNFAEYLHRKETRWFGIENTIFIDVKCPLEDRQYYNNLLNYIIRNGPFYAVIGFSQGAHLIPLLYETIKQCKELYEDSNYDRDMKIFGEIEQFKKLIFMSGFKTPIPLYVEKETLKLDLRLHYELIMDYPLCVDIPTLHIYGQEDEFISNEKSNELVEICKDPEVHIHPRGHILAQDSKSKNIILQFLQK